jgi:hypothetical protein
METPPKGMQDDKEEHIRVWWAIYLLER